VTDSKFTTDLKLYVEEEKIQGLDLQERKIQDIEMLYAHYKNGTLNDRLAQAREGEARLNIDEEAKTVIRIFTKVLV